MKTNWALAFSAIGLTGDAANQQPDPLARDARTSPNSSARRWCRARPPGPWRRQHVASLRDASVASYQDKVKIPTLILQGQADTLFNLNEAVATLSGVAGRTPAPT